MKARIAAVVIAVLAAQASAKLPPPPPVDPVKAEEAKQKDAAAKQKGAELQAKYEDKAVANYAAKVKAEGKEFKPVLGSGIQPPPPVTAAAPFTPAPVTPAPVPGPVAAKK